MKERLVIFTTKVLYSDLITLAERVFVGEALASVVRKSRLFDGGSWDEGYVFDFVGVFGFSCWWW